MHQKMISSDRHLRHRDSRKADEAACRSRFQCLEEVPLFAGLAEDSLLQLERASRSSLLSRGEYLYLDGDSAQSVFIVRDGWMVGLLTHEDGRELVLNEMRRGDLFGQHALLTGAQRSNTVVAHEDSELVELAGDDFLRIVDKEPLLARGLLALAALRLCAGNDRESALAFLGAGARVARILRLLDEMDSQTADRGYVTVSQEELAQRTGLTRQTVARFLGKWRREGWLLTGRGRIMLLNRAALHRVEQQ